MSALARVTEVRHVRARILRVTFSDGLVREMDFESKLPGILATVDDDATFAEVGVDLLAGTVCWPNGIDLDPDVLHGDAIVAADFQPRLVTEYRLQQTG